MSDEGDKPRSNTPQTEASASSGDDGGPRMVECVKFGKLMEGLPKPPLKGELGQRVYEHVSHDAWRMWLEHSKMIVNEFHLDLMSERGQKIWFDELEKFFWGDGSQLPPDFVPRRSK